MKIEKANWHAEGDKVQLSMPIAKVDKERRLVSGYASLDNPDSHGDVVTAEANTKAFSRFRGNIREMHQPVAVGKMVDFKEDDFFHEGKFYRGIFATAYVSKGAPDTWEKVLDGTLTGFSIGGNIIDSETEWVKDAGKSMRFIKDYELVELSLVDSPANKLANIFSIQKTADGQIMKGMVTETSIETVFWCKDDEIARATTDESAECRVCGNDMDSIGWFESDSGDKTEKVAGIVSQFTKANEPATEEGGVNMADEKEKVNGREDEAVVEEGTQVGNVEEVVTDKDPEESRDESAKAAAEDAEEAAAVDETDETETELEKMLKDSIDALNSNVEKSTATSAAQIEEIRKSIDTINEEFKSKIGELDARHADLSEKFSSLKDTMSGVEKRIDGYENETAVRKSSDSGGSEGNEKIEKRNSGSIWGGVFSADSL